MSAQQQSAVDLLFSLARPALCPRCLSVANIDRTASTCWLDRRSTMERVIERLDMSLGKDDPHARMAELGRNVGLRWAGCEPAPIRPLHPGPFVRCAECSTVACSSCAKRRR